MKMFYNHTISRCLETICDTNLIGNLCHDMYVYNHLRQQNIYYHGNGSIRNKILVLHISSESAFILILFLSEKSEARRSMVRCT